MKRTTSAVGIDVSARELVVSAAWDGTVEPLRTFANEAGGHAQLVRWLTKGGRTVRVGLEATGVYSFDLAVARARAPRVEVMVVNPRAARDFARAHLQRAKTDRTDAHTLRAFVTRMPWVAWHAPPAPALALRAVARRIAGLVVARTQERNRLHAATASDALSALVRRDIQSHLRELERRLATLRRDAQALIATEPTLAGPFRHLVSVRGIAAASAIQLLGELAILPGDMTARQWVAHAGLDPRPYESGSSVHRAPRISKVGNRHLRRALYMPALVASRHEPHVRAFAMKLRQRGKTPLQSIVAVMRKLLHAIHGMLRADQDFDPSKFHAVAA
jgi:transposase